MSQTGTAPSPMLAAARATHRFRRQGGQRKGVHGRLQRCCGQTGVLPYTQYNQLLLHCAEPQALHIVHCQGVRHD